MAYLHLHEHVGCILTDREQRFSRHLKAQLSDPIRRQYAPAVSIELVIPPRADNESPNASIIPSPRARSLLVQHLHPTNLASGKAILLAEPVNHSHSRCKGYKNFLSRLDLTSTSSRSHQQQHLSHQHLHLSQASR